MFHSTLTSVLSFIKKSLEAYRLRAAVMTKLGIYSSAKHASLEQENARHLFTSWGDMSRLNVLEQFRPSNDNNALVVENLDFSIRFTFSCFSFVFWQYNGEFQLRCFSGVKYTTQEKMDLMVALVKEWFDIVI